ncbi:hypothetical protein [Pseudoalteromonas sp. OOF1S-7]|uniref:hypothetical protein n=1 Tax=Pseudoalteromonas sp. OOF1S-7 TaxID=2917757 RepID=UPI001EF57ABE|nr:hypothetical protein [Pseudoalteromonas sp. OOF1S-7]MCG7534143.1 hypothetical protein [Pseudoalteromonas sp. OOF1S-7]
MSNSYEQAVSDAEIHALEAVAKADIDTARQSTGYATATPDGAEEVATAAVIAAVQGDTQHGFNVPPGATPQSAEQIATEAVAATE